VTTVTKVACVDLEIRMLAAVTSSFVNGNLQTIPASIQHALPNGNVTAIMRCKDGVSVKPTK